MKNAMKAAIATAFVVMVPVVGLGLTTGEANAQLQRAPDTRLESPTRNEPVRRPSAEPTDVLVVEPVRLEPAGNSGGGLPADDPWITHCLTEHDAGEDIDDCLKDGGL
ncbi:MAG: hypothetical protein AB8B99_02665 [Phormidesmis sp.]